MVDSGEKPDDPLGDLAAVMGERDLRDYCSCRQCGYALRGLPEDRCPECGRRFDRRDPATMKVPKWLQRRIYPPRRSALRRLEDWVFGCLARLCEPVPTHLAVAIVATVLCASWVFSPVGLLFWIILGVKVWWLGCWPPEERRWRKGVAAMLVVSVLASIGYDECKHGRHFGVGPVPGMISFGRPCRFGREPIPLWLWLAGQMEIRTRGV